MDKNVEESSDMVSIIIPAYNREKYLDECIKSVTRQTYEKWEIILVDDGSTDGTYRKSVAWATNDARIRVFYQENQGPGRARNKGMKEAKGEYIAFLDSDDFWRDEYGLEKIMRAVNGRTFDVIGTFYSNYVEEKFVEIPRHRKFFSLGEETGKWISFEEEQDCFGFCSYLYRRAFLEKNEITFPDYLVEQDPPFLAKVLECAKQYYVLPVEFAAIRHRPRKRFTTQRKINDCMRGVLDVIDIAKRGNLDGLLRRMAEHADSNSGAFIKSILEGNVELLQLILELQKKLDSKGIENETLHFIYGAMREEIKRRLNAFLEIIEGSSKLIIYGSGNYGKIFLERIQKLEIVQEIVFAETREPRSREVCGKKCYRLEELLVFKEKALVIVAVKDKKMKEEMIGYMKSLGFENYIREDSNLKIILESGIIDNLACK